MDILFETGSCEDLTLVLGDLELQLEDVRREAAKRLPYFVAEALSPHYRRLAASTDPVLKPSAVLCLSELGGAGRAEELLSLTSSDDVEMRRNALRNVARLHLPDQDMLSRVVRAVRDALEDPEPSVRRTAVDSAMKIRARAEVSSTQLQALVRCVGELMEDPNAEVRAIAAIAFPYLIGSRQGKPE